MLYQLFVSPTQGSNTVLQYFKSVSIFYLFLKSSLNYKVILINHICILTKITRSVINYWHCQKHTLLWCCTTKPFRALILQVRKDLKTLPPLEAKISCYGKLYKKCISKTEPRALALAKYFTITTLFLPINLVNCLSSTTTHNTHCRCIVAIVLQLCPFYTRPLIL